MTRKITECVSWVGHVDWPVRNFHGYTTSRGSTYNAYLVKAGKTVLVDAVKAPYADKLIEKVESGEEYFDFIEVMACPNGCIGGGGQPPASNARKAERCAAIFKEDERCELKIPQQNPALDYVYDELLKGRAHELLHIHYPLHGHHE